MDRYEPDNPSYGPTRFEFSADTVICFRQYRPIDMSYSSLAGSDKNGNLIFYTDLLQVNDTIDDTMPNGTGLNPGSHEVEDSSLELAYGISNGAIFLPAPDSDSLYYLFHITLSNTSLLPQGVVDSFFRYTLIDMSGNHGLGVVRSKNNILVAGYTMGEGGLSACKHGNGRDWWIFVPKLFSNCYYQYLLTPLGLDSLGLQCFGDSFATNTDRGQSCFTPDGSKFIWCTPFDSLHIMDFDRCSGMFSNNRPKIPIYDSLSVATGAYFFTGVAVSPDSRYLYVGSGTELWQFDLFADTIAKSRILLQNLAQDAVQSSTETLQLGPDGKIYINPIGQDTFFHVINTPDSPGLACNFKENGLRTPTYHWDAMPIYPNYRLGALTGSPCDTLRSACTITDTTINISICKGQSYSFGDSIYSQAGSYADTLQNSGGCDSIINLQLTVLPNSADSITASICAGQTYSVGTFTHNQTGSYSDTLQNMHGCDSIVSLQLTVDSVTVQVSQPAADTFIVTGNGNITWLNCDSNRLVEGATSDTFVPKTSGTYAAIVTSGNCADTSECFTAVVNGIQAVSDNQVRIYPNPTGNTLHIILSENTAHTISLYDLNGALLSAFHYEGSSEQLDLSKLSNSIYFIVINADGWWVRRKVVKLD